MEVNKKGKYLEDSVAFWTGNDWHLLSEGELAIHLWAAGSYRLLTAERRIIASPTLRTGEDGLSTKKQKRNDARVVPCGVRLQWRLQRIDDMTDGLFAMTHRNEWSKGWPVIVKHCLLLGRLRPGTTLLRIWHYTQLHQNDTFHLSHLLYLLLSSWMEVVCLCAMVWKRKDTFFSRLRSDMAV